MAFVWESRCDVSTGDAEVRFPAKADKQIKLCKVRANSPLVASDPLKIKACNTGVHATLATSVAAAATVFTVDDVTGFTNADEVFLQGADGRTEKATIAATPSTTTDKIYISAALATGFPKGSEVWELSEISRINLATSNTEEEFGGGVDDPVAVTDTGSPLMLDLDSSTGTAPNAAIELALVRYE